MKADYICLISKKKTTCTQHFSLITNTCCNEKHLFLHDAYNLDFTSVLLQSILHLKNISWKMPMLLVHINIGKEVQKGLETLFMLFPPFAHILFICQDFGEEMFLIFYESSAIIVVD